MWAEWRFKEAIGYRARRLIRLWAHTPNANLTVLRPKSLSCCNPCQPKNNTGIRHNSVRPSLLGCLPQHREILFRHFHIHLDCSFHASLYRGFVIAQQRY